MTRVKKALRGWRMILDKIFTLITFIHLQSVVQEWFPELPSGSQPLHSEQEEETLEDIYARLIVSAKKLAPLKSKENPKVAASNCIHPKESLKGGGNHSSSYITCRMCHCRRENTMRSSEIRNSLKEDKKMLKKGHLSQEGEIGSYEFSQARTMTKVKEHLDRSSLERQVEHMKKEIEEQRIEIRQKSIQSQVLQTALQKMEFEKAKDSEFARMKEVETMIPVKVDKPICACGREAELRAMKKESSRRGRKYWTCAEAACDFFQWLPNEADPDAMSVASFSWLTPQEPSQRSKSPRTSRSEPKRTQGPIEVDSDGGL